METELFLRNTMTDSKQKFVPRNPGGQVKMFTCGPSVYNMPHAGNYRTYLFEDLLERYLEYLGYRVKRLINFTDVEDKAVEKANRLGLLLEDLTRPAEEKFVSECRMLNIRLPRTVARPTESVDQAVYLIKRLMEKGLAYRHQGDIFYDPLMFSGFGKLFGLDMSRWPEKKVRFRKDTYPGQRWNLGDFILWKKRRQSDGPIYWKTELGEGRPAWNVQDAAMITAHLGWELDICCGGIDNIYRHHDYNIAVTEGISGKELADFWLHGGHVRVGGRKMSKSRGNEVYLSHLTDRGYKARHIRFFLICSHYRKPLELDTERLDLARGRLETFRAMTKRLKDLSLPAESATAESVDICRRLEADFRNRMNNDLDAAGAFEKTYQNVFRLLDLALQGNLGSKEAATAHAAIARIDRVLKITV